MGLNGPFLFTPRYLACSSVSSVKWPSNVGKCSIATYSSEKKITAMDDLNQHDKMRTQTWDTIIITVEMLVHIVYETSVLKTLPFFFDNLT